MKMIQVNILKIFGQLPGEESTDPGQFNFFLYLPLISLNLDLIPSVKSDDHGGTWTGSIDKQNLEKKS